MSILARNYFEYVPSPSEGYPIELDMYINCSRLVDPAKIGSPNLS